jgi:hypothetical protein
VLGHVPVNDRIRLLEEVLWPTELHDEVPFLIPSLTAVFGVRNLLAHNGTYGETDDALTLYAVRNGRCKGVGLPREELTLGGLDCGAVQQGASNGLRAASVTQAVWAHLHGVDDR